MVKKLKGLQLFKQEHQGKMKNYKANKCHSKQATNTTKPATQFTKERNFSFSWKKREHFPSEKDYSG